MPGSSSGSEDYKSDDDDHFIPAIPGRFGNLEQPLRQPKAFRALPRGRRGFTIAYAVIASAAILNLLALVTALL